MKTALITGCSSGLGRAMAKCFRDHGFFIVGVSRHEPESGICDLWVSADVTQESGRQKVFDAVTQNCGTLDVLINNAGRGVYATWEELSEAEMKAIFELDFFAVCLMTKRFLPLLEKSHGSVINVSSAAGRLWVPCMGCYCAVKAAVAMFSNSLGIELKSKGIHVLDVAPGQVNTGFSSRSIGSRRPPSSPGSGATSPDGMAACVYRAYTHKRKRITYPRYLTFAIFFVRAFLPALYEKVNRKLWHL